MLHSQILIWFKSLAGLWCQQGYARLALQASHHFLPRIQPRLSVSAGRADALLGNPLGFTKVFPSFHMWVMQKWAQATRSKSDGLSWQYLPLEHSTGWMPSGGRILLLYWEVGASPGVERKGCTFNLHSPLVLSGQRQFPYCLAHSHCCFFKVRDLEAAGALITMSADTGVACMPQLLPGLFCKAFHLPEQCLSLSLLLLTRIVGT